jgi:hypothetical protein
MTTVNGQGIVMTDDEIQLSNPNSIFEGLPPALTVDVTNDDVGECATCGNPVYRPPGNSPTGRKKRIPKYCDEHKSVAKSSGTVVRRRKSRDVDIAEGMTGLYTAFGLMVLPKDPELGAMIVGETKLLEIMNGPKGPAPGIAEVAGKAWADVAAQNPAIAAFLAPLLKTSLWSELIGAHIPIGVHVAQKMPKRSVKMRLAGFRKINRKARQADVNG